MITREQLEARIACFDDRPSAFLCEDCPAWGICDDGRDPDYILQMLTLMDERDALRAERTTLVRIIRDNAALARTIRCECGFVRLADALCATTEGEATK